MEYGVLKKEIIGKFRKYTELNTLDGYCFYDVDVSQEERYYMAYIATPILDENELCRKFIIINGNADELNNQKQNDIQE